MAVSMDCVIAGQNKRRHELELENWQHLNPAKRFCGALGRCEQFENGAVAESPMETWDPQQPGLPQDPCVNSPASLTFTASQSHDMNTVSQCGGLAQPCVRCLAGESGHINHIMGF
ncbi:uncharacterized protein C10orf143 [Amia ocellicauda]|uniref:uncharacterized protein C10orf143 n=1 Tax=Amia ocellicauda TaxID=2972642 RepID=UPI003464B97E